jgi:hypothetical protein
MRAKRLNRGEAPVPELRKDEWLVAAALGVTVGTPCPQRPKGKLLNPAREGARLVGDRRLDMKIVYIAFHMEIRPP